MDKQIPSLPKIKNLNCLSSFDVKSKEEDFTIQLGTNEEKDILIIKIISKDPEKLYFFQSKLNIIELKAASKAFNFYDSIEEIIFAFPKLINKTFEKGEEFIIQIKLHTPEGEIKLSELGIKKVLLKHEQIITIQIIRIIMNFYYKLIIL